MIGGVLQANTVDVRYHSVVSSDGVEDAPNERDGVEGHTDVDDQAGREDNMGEDAGDLTGRKKKLFELRLKMNEARKANQIAMVAEKKKTEAPPESRGMSKQKWIEERKKKIGKLLDANGLDMSKAYMLDTQESAKAKYKKWEKEPAPAGWDAWLSALTSQHVHMLIIVPEKLRYLVLAIAILAAVVGSQAIITGTFSINKQCSTLGWRMSI